MKKRLARITQSYQAAVDKNAQRLKVEAERLQMYKKKAARRVKAAELLKVAAERLCGADSS